MGMDVKAVAFDWDGTMVNNFHVVMEVLRLQFEKGGGNVPSVSEFLSEYKPKYMHYLNGRGCFISEADNWGMWDRVKAQPEFMATLHLGVASLLERFIRQGIPCHIVTANSFERVHTQMKGLHVDTLFTSVFAGQEEKHVALQHICDQQGISPETLVYVGDMCLDMHAAVAVNAIGIGIGSASGYEVEHCDILRGAGAVHAFHSMSAFHNALIDGL